MRLNHYLAESGVTSRRKADELIKSGRVSVNGAVVVELGTKVEEADIVAVDGRVVKPSAEVVTYLLNKPRGVITTVNDPQHRPTVLDFVPKVPRVFPCGRLDEDTQGLIILTNDGNLCYQLTHPKFEHQKEYVVHGRTSNATEAIEKLRRGVELKDGPAKADKLEVLSSGPHSFKFSIIIHEGRNRIVRRMCAACGIEISTLTRTRLGKYSLGNLAPGKFIRL